MAAGKTRKGKIVGTLQLAGRPRRSESAVQDTYNPQHATEEVDEVIVAKAVEWYRLGAMRGAMEALQAMLDGTVTVRRARSGKLQLVAGKPAIVWKQSLTVNTPSERIRTEPYTHKLTFEALGFK